MNPMPKNHPSRVTSTHVSRAQFERLFTATAAAKGEEIAKNLAALKDAIAPRLR